MANGALAAGRRGARWTVLGAAVALLAACGEATAPGESGQVQVVLKEASASQAILADVSAALGASAVPMDAVTAIEITLNRIDLLPADEEETEEGAWVSLEVDPAEPLDLLQLGTTGAIVAQGTVDAGSYTNLRLFFADATITFSEAVVLDGGREIEAGTHALLIPSAEHTGVKVPDADVSVSAGASETVEVEIDTEASVQTLAWTAIGLLMEPVLHAEADAEL